MSATSTGVIDSNVDKNNIESSSEAPVIADSAEYDEEDSDADEYTGIIEITENERFKVYWSRKHLDAYSDPPAFSYGESGSSPEFPESATLKEGWEYMGDWLVP